MEPVSESLAVSQPPASTAASGADRAPQDPGSREPRPPEASFLFSRHLEQRTVVLPDLRVLYLPTPKAGCTTVLWLLAELAGIPADTFARSTLPEVSPALTVHDMSLWGEEHALAYYEGRRRESVLTDEGWFRFSIVRHPGTRLWSAWHSKLLLREPRFVAEFSGEPWFPRVPERPADLVEDFRRFVAALPSGAVEDVHWAVQDDLIKQLPLTHVGKVERLDETLALLQAHVPDKVWPRAIGLENRTALPLPPGAYDEAAAAVLHDRYRADFEHFDYEPVPLADDDMAFADWERRIEPLLPFLRDTIDKHARIGQLDRSARSAQTVEGTAAAVTARHLSPSKAPVLANLEGELEFNVRCLWSESDLQPGFTAVVRVKNEARSLPWVLPPLLRAVRRVVVVDNGSTDGTADVVSRVAEEVGAADRLELHTYPFPIARCGDEHLATPAASVRSLAYFYNWSFSHVRTSYALKWDGDMVLTETAVAVLRDLAWQLEASRAVVKIPRFALYVADDRRAFVDVGMTNCEPWGWPNAPGFPFVKAMEWELPLWPDDIGTIVLPTDSCLELKHLDADEFAHWSHTDFDTTSRTQRKRREWEVFRTLAEGGEPPAGVLEVEAPEGRHIVEYVRSTWLPEKARMLPDSGERVFRKLTRLTA
jgi:Sulfotransferase family